MILSKPMLNLSILVEIFLTFWFEYSKVVPKGFTRLFGKLAELCDEGININLIVGNHDMWTKEYFDQEIGLKTYSDRIIIEESNKKNISLSRRWS